MDVALFYKGSHRKQMTDIQNTRQSKHFRIDTAIFDLNTETRHFQTWKMIRLGPIKNQYWLTSWKSIRCDIAAISDDQDSLLVSHQIFFQSVSKTPTMSSRETFKYLYRQKCNPPIEPKRDALIMCHKYGRDKVIACFVIRRKQVFIIQWCKSNVIYAD